MWQRSSAILLMPLAACSLVLGINDVEINDAGPSTAHYDGIHYGYVVDRAFIPTTQLQAQQYGLDLGSATSSKLDGMADNSFGTTLAILSAQGFHIQQKVDSLIDH